MPIENDLTKLARWVIPGWISILSLFIFFLIDGSFTVAGKPKIFNSVSELFQLLPYTNDFLTAILLAASGIPLGFSIYQFYFFLRWNSPFSRDGLLSPLLPGRKSDLAHSIRDISQEELSVSMDWRRTWVNNPFFEYDHKFRWRYIELLFTEAAQVIDTNLKGLSVYSRHRYLHEVVHTLGASIIAIYVGFFGYLLVKYLRTNIYFPTYMLVVFCFVAVMFYLMHIEESSCQPLEINSRSENELRNYLPALLIRSKTQFFNRTVIVYPSSFFIIFILELNLFANPVINKSIDFIDTSGRLILSLIVMLIWIYSKKKATARIIIGDVFIWGTILLISTILRFLSNPLSDWIDWSFFTPLSVFLIANLILFQNRQNAKEDMLALEYFTLRRFLNEKPIVPPNNS